MLIRFRPASPDDQNITILEVDTLGFYAGLDLGICDFSLGQGIVRLAAILIEIEKNTSSR